MSGTVLVLCGGIGSRFRSISSSPKILAPFRDGRFIDWLLPYLHKQGFDRVVLSVGYKAEEIQSFVEQQSYPLAVEFLKEENQLGTGGALLNFFNQYQMNEVCVVNGDTFWTKDFPSDFHKKHLNLAICLTKTLAHNDRYGDMVVKAGQLSIKRGSVNAPIRASNIYIGVARVSSNISFNNLEYPFSLETLFQQQKGGVGLVDYDGGMIDFGVPDAYRELLESQ